MVPDRRSQPRYVRTDAHLSAERQRSDLGSKMPQTAWLVSLAKCPLVVDVGDWARVLRGYLTDLVLASSLLDTLGIPVPSSPLRGNWSGAAPRQGPAPRRYPAG